MILRDVFYDKIDIRNSIDNEPDYEENYHRYVHKLKNKEHNEAKHKDYYNRYKVLLCGAYAYITVEDYITCYLRVRVLS